ETNTFRRERNIDLLLSGDHQLSTDFSLTYNVGGSLLKRTGGSVESLANGLSIPNQFNLAFATTPTFNNITFSDLELNSIYRSAQLRVPDYIFLDVTARNDWSYTLPNPQIYFYPSVGISAVISDMVDMPDWITFGKDRASNTEVGNDAAPYLLE